MSIIDAANNLGKMISQSEEIGNLNKAQIDFLNDKNLQKEYEDYKKIYNSYIKTKNIELESQIDMKYEKLLSNTNFSNYVKAKDDFEKLVVSVHDLIDFHIDYQKPKSCCKDNNGCSGCSKK